MNSLVAQLDKHLEYGNKCNLFFESCEKRTLLPKQGNREQALFMVHMYNQVPFSTVFNDITNQCLQTWEADYERLKLEGDSLQLEEVKQKIDQCKAADDVFRAKIILLFRKNPEILLEKDTVFFLSGIGESIGECHCCELVNRQYRTYFSRELCTEVSTKFSKEKPLTIASFGAGLCFHEIEIHHLMTEKGYKIDRWVIVDPALFPKTFANFKTLVQFGNPETDVVSKNEKGEKYFAALKTSQQVPDIFLFLDVDLHFSSREIEKFCAEVKQQKPQCLFAEMTKNGDNNFL